jgi:hypothetical protein
MDNNKIAEELMKLSKDVQSAGSDINIQNGLNSAYRKMSNNVYNQVTHKVKRINGEIDENEKMSSNSYTRLFAWDAYNRSDDKVEIVLYLDFSKGLECWVLLTIKDRYGSHDHIKKSFNGEIPVSKIIAIIENALG